jgi:hypothetical protein
LTGERLSSRGNKIAHRAPGDLNLDRGDDELVRNVRNLGIAKRIVSELVPLAGTFGETYLTEERGIDVEAITDVIDRADALGWHPSVLFREPDHPLDGRHLWCIVGVMTDPRTGARTGAISRTYLSLEGKKIGKAKTLGVPAGIIRLSADEDVAEGLHLAEGLETALAAMAIGLRPMWATGSTSLMKGFPILPGIETLNVIADHDENRAGERVAEEVVARYRAAKIIARDEKVWRAGSGEFVVFPYRVFTLQARILRSAVLGDLNDAVMRKAAS